MGNERPTSALPPPTVLDVLSDIFTLLEGQQEINTRVANALEELVEIAKEDRPARLGMPPARFA